MTPRGHTSRVPVRPKLRLARKARRLTRLAVAHNSQGRAKAHGDLVAKLSFSFWVGLLAHEYGAEASAKAALKWQPEAPATVFPGVNTETWGTVNRAFTRIRHFRNRVFHHEPVWPKTDMTLPPKELYDEIALALRWIGGTQAKLPMALHGSPENLVWPDAVESMTTRLDTTVQLLLERSEKKKTEKDAKKAHVQVPTPATTPATTPAHGSEPHTVAP